MQSKQVRRRRAVVAALVVVSLVLLTAYFGASASSPLHAIQRGIVTVFSPVQEGASKALAPFRDIANFFSDTFKAKSQVASYRSEVHRLQAELAQAQYAASQNAQLAKEVGLDKSNGIASYRPVAADVIGRDPSLWYATIEVNKGTADGVRQGDPVTGDGALVGQVSVAGSDYSVVTLITDPNQAEAAQVADTKGDSGVLVPAVGNPNQLVLQYLPKAALIQVGQTVMTVGFRSGGLQDLYPPGIPIGTVASVGNDLPNNGEIQVTPAADLRHLSVVWILTSPHAGTERAQLPGG
ncbi:MAG TPA: rod shape-determining protein MreC [Solirubrobacteraceae bacterium]